MPIKLNNASVKLSKKVILSHLSFSFKSEGISFLLGRNGAGKTQLLRLINGLSQPSSGQIEIPKNIKQAIIFQHPVLLNRSVFENLLFVAKQCGISSNCFSEKIEQSLALFDLSHLSHQNATTLSGGQKKRVAIARAYLQDVQVYLFDEPSANIDISTNLKIEKVIKQLASDGKKIILSTHDPSQIKRLIRPDRDEIIILKKGELAMHTNQPDFAEISHLL